MRRQTHPYLSPTIESTCTKQMFSAALIQVDMNLHGGVLHDRKNHDCVTNYINLILQRSSINLTIKTVEKLQEKILFTFRFTSKVFTFKKITINYKELSMLVYEDSTQSEHSVPHFSCVIFFESNH